MTDELNKKVAASIKLLQRIAAAHPDTEIELAYSGGKDSDVILQLAKEAGIKYRAIYKNTTIDPPGTISHVKAMGVEIVQPKQSFFKLIERKGLPNRWVRHCCAELKEYKILDTVILGVRREESRARAERYKEPTQCRYYGKAKTEKNHVEQVFPILDWTLDDVKEFILDRGVKLAPRYYDADGTMHIKRRLGCVGCPLANRPDRLRELKEYPLMVKAMVKHSQIFLDNHPNHKSIANTGYEQVVFNLFYENKDDMRNAQTGGVLGSEGVIDCKKVLEDYFNIKL